MLVIIIALSIILVSNWGWLLPLYLLPSLLFYFYCVGLSIGVSVLSKERKQLVFIVLVASSILLPYIFVPLYIGVGVLDSFMNFRALLSKQIKYRF